MNTEDLQHPETGSAEETVVKSRSGRTAKKKASPAKTETPAAKKTRKTKSEEKAVTEKTPQKQKPANNSKQQEKAAAPNESAETKKPRQSAKKKSKSAPEKEAASVVTPSIEEVSAFISSLKSAKTQPKKGPSDPTPSTEKPARSVREGSENLSSQTSDSKAQQSGQQSATSSENAATEGNGEEPRISRREKRRLEWLEKRRQWRDQKKLERMQRRLEKGESAADDESDEMPQDENDLMPNEPMQQRPAQAPKAQPAQQNQQKQPSQANQANQQKQGAPQNQQQRQNQPKQGRNPNEPKHDGQKPPTDKVAAPNDQQRHPKQQQQQKKGQQPPAGAGVKDESQPVQQAAAPTKEAGAKQGTQAAEQAQQPKSKSRRDNQRSRKGGGDQASEQAPQAQGEERVQAQAHPADKKKGGRHADKQRSTPPHDEVPPPLPEPKRDLAPVKQYYVFRDIRNKPELPEAAARIVQRVEDFLQNELLVEDGESILIGVSGGVDSVVLLDILHVLSFEHAFVLNIAHVNHGLRGNAAKRDEKFVKALAQSYDIPCHSTQVKVDEFAKKHSLSLEVAARELRYKFFRQTCSTLRTQVCATAHNADDAAETMLMNLFRGTGLTGLAGIPSRRPLVKKTQLVRPLLQLSREEILEYAGLRELEWYEDETNTLTRFTRNKVRHDLLPKLKEEYNPKIVESLNRTAQLLRRADGFIDSLIHSTYHSVVQEKEDSCVIDIHRFEALHDFLQGEIVERAISTLTFGRTVSFAAIDRIVSLLSKEVGTRENVVNNLIAIREADSIVMMYEQHLQEIFLTTYKLGEYSIGKYKLTLEECQRNDVRIGQNKMIEYFDYDRLPYRLTLRTWHPAGIQVTACIQSPLMVT